MKTHIPFFITVATLLTGCTHEAYFLSPFQANNHPYKSMPMVSDPNHKEAYASGVVSIGGANQSLQDVVVNVQGSLHQAHTFQKFQFHYGITGSAGNYRLSDADFTWYTNSGPVNGRYSDRADHFFAGLGAFGGINFVIPFRTGSEWRVIGLETSYQREFGDYQSFRKGLRDSVVNAVARRSHFHTVGLTTNVIKKFRKSGNTFGFKFGIYMSTDRINRMNTYYGRNIIPGYGSATLHLTRQRVTGFAQINAGTFAANFQTGVNVRL